MAESPSTREAIVTLRSLPAPPTIEAAAESEAQAEIDPIEKAQLLRRYRELREKLEEEQELVGDGVIVTSPDPELSRLQSRLAELALDGDPLAAGGQEVKFGTGAKGGDWFGWMKSTLDWVKRKDAHPFVWSTAPPLEISGRYSVALAGDWGTGLYGAPKIARSIAATGPYDLLLHLGDVYYSGTASEVKDRFLAVWPHEAGRMSRALNANHEMYSGGYGYFDLILAKFEQPASYFALRNDHWLLIGLDTAYVDHDLDLRQVAWLERQVAERGGRKVVLFSHQQLFSRIGGQGAKLQPKLDALLRSRQITAWYWGHEHQCLIYDRHPEWGLAARCLGNGGIPEPREKKIRHAPAEKETSYIAWRRLETSPETPWSPRCLALDGPNPDVKGREKDFGPHAYMTLQLDGPTLVERVFLPDGTEIFENTLS